MRDLFKLVLLVVFVTQATVSAKADDKDIFGTLLGGAIGGLLGNQFGNGDGKIAMTALGVIIGGAIGHEIGEALDDADRQAMAQTQNTCLSEGRTQPMTWQGHRSGNRGEMQVIRSGSWSRSSSVVCREYSNVIYVNGRNAERTQGVACYRENRWQETRIEEVVFTDRWGNIQSTVTTTTTTVEHERHGNRRRDRRHDRDNLPDIRPHYDGPFFYQPAPRLMVLEERELQSLIKVIDEERFDNLKNRVLASYMSYYNQSSKLMSLPQLARIAELFDWDNSRLEAVKTVARSGVLLKDRHFVQTVINSFIWKNGNEAIEARDILN